MQKLETKLRKMILENEGDRDDIYLEVLAFVRPLIDGLIDISEPRGAYNPILDVGGDTIDLRKVEKVGPVGGDRSWLRYSVYFTGGSKIEIYQERKYADGTELRQMKREKFIEMWRHFSSS